MVKDFNTQLDQCKRTLSEDYHYLDQANAEYAETYSKKKKVAPKEEWIYNIHARQFIYLFYKRLKAKN